MVKLLQTSVVVVRSFFCSLTCLTLASSASKVWFEKVFRGARGFVWCMLCNALLACGLGCQFEMVMVHCSVVMLVWQCAVHCAACAD